MIAPLQGSLLESLDTSTRVAFLCYLAAVKIELSCEKEESLVNLAKPLWIWSVCVSRQDKSRLGEQRGLDVFATTDLLRYPQVLNAWLKGRDEAVCDRGLTIRLCSPPQNEA